MYRLRGACGGLDRLTISAAALGADARAQALAALVGVGLIEIERQAGAAEDQLLRARALLNSAHAEERVAWRTLEQLGERQLDDRECFQIYLPAQDAWSLAGVRHWSALKAEEALRVKAEGARLAANRAHAMARAAGWYHLYM